LNVRPAHLRHIYQQIQEQDGRVLYTSHQHEAQP